MNMEAMVIQYRDETSTRVRVFIAVVVIPFFAILAVSFVSIFGLFGRNALELVRSTLLGDFNRFDDFAGYLVLLLISVGLPCIAIYVLIIKGVVSPNIIVTIDPNRRMVSIRRDPPWRSSNRAEYAFSDVEAIELEKGSLTFSEQNEISLRISGLKRPLILARIFDSEAAAKEFRKLMEMGLPGR